MLKHNDIISKLTEQQKVRILTGIGNLSGKDLKVMGIPTVKVASMKDYYRDTLPHATELVNSWDVSLWQRVAFARTKAMAKDKVGFAIVPSAKIKLSPYRMETTEDPFLSSELSAAHSRGATAAGMDSGISRCYITEADIEFLDTELNSRVMGEYVINPFVRAVERGGAKAILTDTHIPNENYGSACKMIQDGVHGCAEFLLCGKAAEDKTVDFISRGIICLEASANALEVAMNRYKKIKASLERNEGVTAEQIEEDIAAGVSISDETVDAALDIALEFIFRANECAVRALENPEPKPIDDLALDAAVKSTVLLKNNKNILPLSKGRKIGIIGAIGSGDGISTAEQCCEALAEAGYTCTGTALGYNTEDVEDGSFVQSALNLCDKSDVIILLLGFGHKMAKSLPKLGSLALPANQLDLANRISKRCRRVITVIASGHAPDIDFTRLFSALLLAPLEIKCAGRALADILSGRSNPSGKLAYSLYSGSETAFRKALVYKNRYGVKSGPFIGYRYYDTADMRLGYPFGHGLSYSSFKYSELSLEDGTVTFTVLNTSDVRGAEVAEVYIGKSSSAVLRPKKELCGFVRVELDPGEERTVSVKVDALGVYHEGEYLIEEGSYTVYVGSSVSDIRLRGNMNIGGVKLEGDGERLFDYLQTVSNVKEDKFTLEADYSLMKKSVKNILFGIGTLALAVSIAIFNSVTLAASMFLGIVSGILAVGSIVFFILEAVERSRAYKEERARINEANEEYFNGAETLPALSTDRMFEDEFDIADTSENQSVEYIEDVEDEGIAEFIDDKFTISDAALEFNRFALEKGYKLANGVAERLLCSMADTKLVLVDGLDKDDFNSFMLLVSEYFGSDAYVDYATDEEGEGAFFAENYHNDLVKKNILLAMDSARKTHEGVHIAGVNGVKCGNILTYITPFMKYINSPKSMNEIRILNAAGNNVGQSIPSNFWLFIGLNSGEPVDNLPLSVASLGALNRIAFTRVKESEEQSFKHGFSRYQFDYIVDKVVSKTEVAEELWKRVDKLTAYAHEHSEFTINNKLWLGLEKQLQLLICCGNEPSDALDMAIATRIVAPITVSLKGKLTEEDKSLPESIEFIFGEGKAELSKEYVTSIAAQAKAYEALVLEKIRAEAAAKAEAEAAAKAEAEAAPEAVVESAPEAEAIAEDESEAIVEVEEEDTPNSSESENN